MALTAFILDRCDKGSPLAFGRSLTCSGKPRKVRFASPAGMTTAGMTTLWLRLGRSPFAASTHIWRIYVV